VSDKHPIEGLMQTAMESLKTMVDVNTILGDPVETPDEAIILPVNRVSVGFAAEKSEFSGANAKGSETDHPFGGGSGAGIALNPVAFLVVGRESVRLLPVNQNAIYDRLIDAVPAFIDQIQGMVQGRSSTNGVLRTTYKV